jgi:hypothetical protein
MRPVVANVFNLYGTLWNSYQRDSAPGSKPIVGS